MNIFHFGVPVDERLIRQVKHTIENRARQKRGRKERKRKKIKQNSKLYTNILLLTSYFPFIFNFTVSVGP